MKRVLLLLIAINFIIGCKTPMAKLIKEGKTEELKQRLLAGENPNEVDCDSPLIVAANRGDIELTKLLLDKGANPNLRSLECVYGSGYGQFKMGTRSALAEAKTLEIAKLLVEKGANLNLGSYKELAFTTAFYTSPLREHIRDARYDIANFLIDSGANVNNYSDDGKNSFLSLLTDDKLKNPDAVKLKSKLIAKGAKDFNFDKYKTLVLDRIVSYKHDTYGGETSMPGQFQSPLWENPKKFSPLTIYAGDGNYYHYSEFTDVGSKMNLYEWYVVRIDQVKNKK